MERFNDNNNWIIIQNGFSVHDVLEELYEAPDCCSGFQIIRLITIIIMILTECLYFIVILYEKYGMDPMKRSLSNRLVSILAQFVIISIGTSIVKELAMIFCLQISKIALSYFTQTARLGIALVLNELIFWKYLKQVLFRRILCINNDFIGIWLEITNLVIAAYLTMVQAHDISIKMNIILYGLVLLQLFFASIHYLLKKPKKNQVMHINIQPSEPIQVEFLPMNNLQFNPELLNLKIIGVILTTILTIWFLFGLRIYRWGNKTAELIALVFGYNSSMPILEFADMLRPTLLAFLQLVIACAYFGNSKKMQRFTQNLLKCRWEEL